MCCFDEEDIVKALDSIAHLNLDVLCETLDFNKGLNPAEKIKKALKVSKNIYKLQEYIYNNYDGFFKVLTTRAGKVCAYLLTD